MCGKVEGHTMKTMVSRERRVEGPRAHVIEGELGLGDQVVLAVRGKCDVGGRKYSDDVVFGGTNCSFRRIGAMVKEREGRVGR